MNRYESAKKVGFLGITGNLFLLIIKFIVSIYSHSEAMFADAINSAGDIFSSLMTYIGGKIASTPSDDDHNFGHGKAEYIFSLLISIFMLFISSKILCDSILAIITKKEFIFSFFLVIVALTTIVTKLILYLYCKNIYKKSNNILVKSNMKDHRNDILLTMGTLISIILGYFHIYYADGIIGSIIALYILVTGLSIFNESYKVLMDVSIDNATKEDIINYINKKKNIINVKDFYTVATGYKYIAILTIEVDGNLKTFKSHQIADNLEQEIPEKFRKIYKLTVHVNPIKIPQNKNH